MFSEGFVFPVEISEITELQSCTYQSLHDRSTGQTAVDSVSRSYFRQHSRKLSSLNEKWFQITHHVKQNSSEIDSSSGTRFRWFSRSKSRDNHLATPHMVQEILKKVFPSQNFSFVPNPSWKHFPNRSIEKNFKIEPEVIVNRFDRECCKIVFIVDKSSRKPRFVFSCSTFFAENYQS